MSSNLYLPEIEEAYLRVKWLPGPVVMHQRVTGSSIVLLGDHLGFVVQSGRNSYILCFRAYMYMCAVVQVCKVRALFVSHG